MHVSLSLALFVFKVLFFVSVIGSLISLRLTREIEVVGLFNEILFYGCSGLMLSFIISQSWPLVLLVMLPWGWFRAYRCRFPRLESIGIGDPKVIWGLVLLIDFLTILSYVGSREVINGFLRS